MKLLNLIIVFIFFIVLMTLGTTFLYGIISFYFQTYNAKQWSQDGRFVLIECMGVVTISAFMTYLLYDIIFFELPVTK